MTSREKLRHIKNFCGEECEISDVLLQGNSATVVSKEGKKNVITITPVDELSQEDRNGTLELITAFYNSQSLVLCGRLNDSTRFCKIQQSMYIKIL